MTSGRMVSDQTQGKKILIFNWRDERHDLAGRRREGQRASRGIGEVIVTARAVIHAIAPIG